MTLNGLLFIGDPHVSSRVPGFRSDDYPRAILKKLEWCRDYALQNRLKTAILGDLFNYPRDNANWLLKELIDLFRSFQPLAIYGNHDVHENTISSDDSFSVLAASGALQLLEPERPWSGEVAGRQVVVGGTSWGKDLPTGCDLKADHVFWMTHHDLLVPGYEEFGRLRPKDLPGIDAVINGHIHRVLEVFKKGQTSWITPGNIARVSRGDATRDHTPAVLRINFQDDGWATQWVTIPHGDFDDVFYDQVKEAERGEADSMFIHGLTEMKARRTDSGAGLRQFLDDNLPNFEEQVRTEINKLAGEVLDE